MGLVAPQHVGSSQTRARTRVPCVGRRILNYCATREAPMRDYCCSCFHLNTDRAGFDSRAVEERSFSPFLFWWKIWKLHFQSEGQESKQGTSSHKISGITCKVKIMTAAIRRKVHWCFCWRDVRSGFRKRPLHSCWHWQYQDPVILCCTECSWTRQCQNKGKKWPWQSSSQSLIKWQEKNNGSD